MRKSCKLRLKSKIFQLLVFAVDFSAKFSLIFVIWTGDDRCQCNCTPQEAELREKKLKLILREEEELYKMKKHEQELKNEIAAVQLKIIEEKKAYLTKKRKLQLQLLSSQLQNSNRTENDGKNYSKFSSSIGK